MATKAESLLEALYRSSPFSGGNAPYVEALYESWLEQPDSVGPEWQQAFSALPGDSSADIAHTPVIERFRLLSELSPGELGGGSSEGDHKQAGVMRLINAYRSRGHLKANLNPLAQRPADHHVPDLDMAFHDLGEDDLERQYDTGYLGPRGTMRLREVIELCEKAYCSTIGYEFMHITDIEQRRWLQARIEEAAGDFGFSDEHRRRILRKLTAAEGLEKYLHTKYVGQKRFSLEGGDSLIPMLDELIQRAGNQGVREMVLGMAHRGRLNVLVNILGKKPADLFAEFEGKGDSGLSMGDVKYHMGYSSDLTTAAGSNLHLALAFNPSHLEIVDPVVAGSAKARLVRRRDEEYDEVLPVLIHGDAALAGQGVVMELFNMSQARGFKVGGTLHIVINNQIGFTTSNVLDTRSTLYCTEVAKMVQAPIMHVNGDDPEAVAWATQVAVDFRRQFEKDVMIDLVCYRRHGHNEADEPAATQPVMYQVIRKLKTTREQYAERLTADGVLSDDLAKQMVTDFRDALDEGDRVTETTDEGGSNEFSVDWGPYLGTEWTDPVNTGMDQKRLVKLSRELTVLPDDFSVHNRVQRILDDRVKMADGELPLDWGFAETAAYASLIDAGYNLRLVGQDSGRGTFFHRHAILHNQKRKETLLPLARLASEGQHVTVIDSLLSEEAVLGFEYGYAASDPETLVLWEAQFGDFANGAQVVIDQFITSGEAKWGRLCGLVMLLPHGFEGQGPEHSSARLERFLQLCSHNNIQVCVPSTPAQMFHMLRRQMLRPWRKPLIVMTPKSLLRHKQAVNTLQDLSQGEFQLVIDDADIENRDKVERVVLCSGKVWYDLAEDRAEGGQDNVALVRVEQLYPFPREAVVEVLGHYSKATDVTWCQEEPQNQGAWYQIRHHLQACVGKGQSLTYVGRDASPSPAVGYYSKHVEEQNALVEQALTPGQGEQA